MIVTVIITRMKNGRKNCEELRSTLQFWELRFTWQSEFATLVGMVNAGKHSRSASGCLRTAKLEEVGRDQEEIRSEIK